MYRDFTHKSLNILKGLFLLSAFVLSFLYIQAQDQVSTSEKLKEIVKYLASDELEGRYPGTAGNAKAANFIIQQFKQMGLIPLGDNYKQNFQFTTGIKPSPASAVSFKFLSVRPGVPKEMWKTIEKKWTTGEDWQPLGFSENTNISDLELAFVGYGLTDKEKKYDDYEGIDVKGKAAIVLTDNYWKDKKNYFRTYDYGELREKIINAREHGARAIIILKSMGDSANEFFPLKYERMFNNSGIIVIQANRTSLAKFFPKSEPLLELEQQIDKAEAPKSFLLPDVKISLNVELQQVQATIPNIIGMVKGTDSKISDEYIVIGAHFDHLGWGGENSMYRGKVPKIHYGADDNASGVSAVIELASRIAKKPLRRSVIFMSFNGEEEGLLGSAYYVRNPIIPLEKTVFMLNLDMVGRLAKDRKLNVFGTVSSPKFSQIIDTLASLDTMMVVKSKEAYGPSDQSSFYSKGVPIIFLFTGVHGDYHTPTDTWDKINYEGIVVVDNFAEMIARTIGNQDQKPEFVKAPVDTNDGENKQMKYGSGAWFGIVPSFEENPDGFLITGTSEGSPAQKAGLKSGDVITKFGERKIGNIYDLTSALQHHKSGDVVDVWVLRNHKEIKFKVTLAKKN